MSLISDKQAPSLEKIQAAAYVIKDRLNQAKKVPLPKVGVILGSGLGDIAEKELKNNTSIFIDYEEIPNFPVSSVIGHSNKFHYNQVQQVPTLIMQGRSHCYEGYTARQVVFSVQVMMNLGIKTLILTNSSGGISNNLDTDDLMLITDHINLTGKNPLVGENDLRLGPRFPDMSQIYDIGLIKTAQKHASALNINIKQGVYAGVLGPSYETPAEIKMLASIGADCVGMSTVLEAICAKHGGASVMGISCITNKAAGKSNQKITHDDVTRKANQNGKKLIKLLESIILAIS